MIVYYHPLLGHNYRYWLKLPELWFNVYHYKDQDVYVPGSSPAETRRMAQEFAKTTKYPLVYRIRVIPKRRKA